MRDFRSSWILKLPRNPPRCFVCGEITVGLGPTVWSYEHRRLEAALEMTRLRHKWKPIILKFKEEPQSRRDDKALVNE
uniref:Uncharacterized protein n=1 Tax=Knipowitschia caucasica TaxID=637954 RepID=A0AAV2IWD9_KNICA